MKLTGGSSRKRRYRALVFVAAAAAAAGDELQQAAELRRAGIAHYRDGSFEQSLALYEQARDLAPAMPESHASVLERREVNGLARDIHVTRYSTGHACRYVGAACYKLDRLECAEQGFTAAIDLGTAKGLDPRQSIPYRSNLGGVLHKSKRFDQAIDVFTEAIAIAPDDPNLKMNLEATLIDQKKYFMELEIVSAGQGGSSDFWDVRNLLNGKNYSEKAEVIFKEVVEQRSAALIPPALALLREARRMEPRFAISAHLLADIAVRVGDLLKAELPPAELAGLDVAMLQQEAEREMLSTLMVPEDLAGDSRTHASVWVESGGQPSPAQLHVVAVATELKDELKLLYSSALALGHEMAILGLGAPWRGLGSKIDLLQDHLRDKPADDVVLFVDAYDVLLLADTRHVVPLFESFNSSLVFSAELSCAPDGGLKLLYNSIAAAESKSGPFSFVNSGSYIGRVGNIQAMLDEVQKDIALHHTINGADPHRLDDQRWFNRFYLRQHARSANQTRITLDHAGRMFHTLHGIPPDAFSSVPGATGSVHSATTGSQPCLVHGNGEGITTYQGIANFLVERGWPSASVMDQAAVLLAALETRAFGPK